MGTLVGELAALATAGCWTVTAMSFEAAGRRIGSLSVNLIRLLIGLLLLCVFCWLVRGLPLPTDASRHAWIFLSLSGLIGFTIGDLALFRAFVLIGSRLAMLLMSLVPPMSALIGWLLLGEVLGPWDWLGMALTVGGVSWVIAQRERIVNNRPEKISPTGVLLGLLGALGQAGGLVLSKYGMGDYSPFAATQIRIIAGIVGFALLFTVIGWWPKVAAGLANRPAMARVSLGAFFGPFLGVSFSLLAVQHTATGVAATIMSITPILIIPPAVLLFKEKVNMRAVIGAAIAIGGVVLLFLK